MITWLLRGPLRLPVRQATPPLTITPPNPAAACVGDSEVAVSRTVRTLSLRWLTW